MLRSGFNSSHQFLLRPTCVDQISYCHALSLLLKPSQKNLFIMEGTIMNRDLFNPTNYHAIALLESLGNLNPTQKQIDAAEHLVNQALQECSEKIKKQTILVEPKNFAGRLQKLLSLFLTKSYGKLPRADYN